MKPEIEDDIEMLIQFTVETASPNSFMHEVAKRVEAWLATYSPHNN